MPELLCPLCRLPLQRGERTVTCANRHAFDIAREGYLNLLPVQQKKSRDPGDNDAMVQARRAFLDAGHYAPLRDAVVALARPLAARTLLDIGCGEGYYTAALAQVAADVTGIDIAKNAVQRAAKRYPGITWLVGSSAQLPLAAASIDLACSLFSPLPAAELARVLRPGGHLLVATPAADHLQALRAALFDSVQPHRPEKFADQLGMSFVPQSVQDVRSPLQLDAAALQQLLLMTPYAWRAQPERRDALLARGSLATVAAFSVQLFRFEPTAGA